MDEDKSTVNISGSSLGQDIIHEWHLLFPSTKNNTNNSVYVHNFNDIHTQKIS